MALRNVPFPNKLCFPEEYNTASTGLWRHCTKRWKTELKFGNDKHDRILQFGVHPLNNTRETTKSVAFCHTNSPIEKNFLENSGQQVITCEVDETAARIRTRHERIQKTDYIFHTHSVYLCRFGKCSDKILGVRWNCRDEIG